MYYNNNQNRPKTSVYGCSSTTLTIGLIVLFLVISGGLFFVLRYFGLILALGIVIWFFRKFIMKDNKKEKSSKETRTNNWSRDFEKKEDTSYDNFEREFEEIDDDDDE